MGPKSQTLRVLQFIALVAVTATLPACQKAKMSSVQKSNTTAQPTPPTYPPGTYPPGTVPRPPGVVQPPPGIVQPPPGVVQPPPIVRQPPVVVEPPPRRPPPTVVTQPPVVTTPPIPRVDPPRPPVDEVPVVVDRPPVTTTQPPVVTTQPPTVVTQPPVVTTQPPAGPVVVGQVPVSVPAPVGSGGSIQVGRGVVVTEGATPVISSSRVRVLTPMSTSSQVLATCGAGKCQPRQDIFIGGCDAKDKCTIQTIEVERQEQWTCPLIEMRARPYTNKLDILFVVDTSASMKAERAEIARQMTSFINELSPDVEYRIAVMLGHGPESKKSVVGELFTPSSMSQTYGVINLDSLLVGAQQNARRYTQDEAKINAEARAQMARLAAARLTEMMLQVPNDDSKVQGEAGLLNLYTAVNNPVRLNEMKRRGFWRDEAAKAVVFIADENDVCYDYADLAANAGKTIKARAANVAKNDAYGRDPVEIDSFERGDVCRSSANGQRLSARLVHDAVVKSSKMPIIFSGVLYLENSSIPNQNDKYRLDNEMGRGYLDVIALGKGKAADLAQKNFGASLAKLGDFTDFKMKYDHVFPMRDVRDVTDIDPSSLSVSIQDLDGKEYVFNATNVKLEIDAQANSAKVIIEYEVLAEIYKQDMVKQGSKVVIRYSTKSGVRPAAKAKADKAEEVVSDATAAPQLAPVEDRSRPGDPADTVAKVEELRLQQENAERAARGEGQKVYYQFLGLKIPGYVKSEKEIQADREMNAGG